MAKNVVCDCCYNKNKQLAKALQLVANIEGYKKDAKKLKHKDCLKLWNSIERNARNSAEILSRGIEQHIKKKGLC